MPLGPGARLGPYEVVAAVGAGGMGEVYRARDTKLNRDVALKILPAAWTSDGRIIVVTLSERIHVALPSAGRYEIASK